MIISFLSMITRRVAKAKVKKEIELANWCAEQTRRYWLKELTLDQIAKLETLPQWSWTYYLPKSGLRAVALS